MLIVWRNNFFNNGFGIWNVNKVQLKSNQEYDIEEDKNRYGDQATRAYLKFWIQLQLYKYNLKHGLTYQGRVWFSW